MYSESYYNKKFIYLFILINIISYVFLIVLVFIKIRGNTELLLDKFIKNYNLDYNISINKTNISDEDISNNSLYNIEYDNSSMYIDWSIINKRKQEIEDNYKSFKETLIDNIQEFDFVNNSIINKPTISQFKVVEGSLNLPNIDDTSFKGYMCFHKITSKSSKQWKFLRSGDFKFTTDEHGILKYNDYYVVAMASYYTNYKVGSTFRITLDSGIVFDIITGDEKADKDTDELNMYRPKSNGRGEIIEFIVACGLSEDCCVYHTMTPNERALGNLSSLGFQGNVVKIEKLDDYYVSDILY